MKHKGSNLDIPSFFSASLYDFPSKGTIYIQLSQEDISRNHLNHVLQLKEGEGDTFLDTNKGNMTLLNELEVHSELAELAHSPEAHPEFYDVWIAFMCYLYIAFPGFWEWSTEEIVDALENIETPDGKAKCDFYKPLHEARLNAPVRFLINDILKILVSRLKTEAFFSVTGMTLKECVLCQSYHDAMLYYLLLHIAHPKAGANGLWIKHCEECGEAFVAKSARASYCKLHSSEAARSKRYRRGKDNSEAIPK